MWVSWLRTNPLIAFGVLASLVLLVLLSSPVYVAAVALAGGLWLGLRRFLPLVPGRPVVLWGAAAILLWGAGGAAAPPPVHSQLPPASGETALPIPTAVLANPTTVGVWLTWAQQNPTNARTAPGVVALEVGMLAHPGIPFFAADLAFAYEMMAKAGPSWTDALIARYYGIQAGLVPPTPLSPIP